MMTGNTWFDTAAYLAQHPVQTLQSAPGAALHALQSGGQALGHLPAAVSQAIENPGDAFVKTLRVAHRGHVAGVEGLQDALGAGKQVLNQWGDVANPNFLQSAAAKTGQVLGFTQDTALPFVKDHPVASGFLGMESIRADRMGKNFVRQAAKLERDISAPIRRLLPWGKPPVEKASATPVGSVTADLQDTPPLRDSPKPHPSPEVVPVEAQQVGNPLGAVPPETLTVESPGGAAQKGGTTGFASWFRAQGIALVDRATDMITAVGQMAKKCWSFIQKTLAAIPEDALDALNDIALIT